MKFKALEHQIDHQTQTQLLISWLASVWPKRALAYNAANELLQVRDVVFIYDANGNVVTKANEDPSTPLGAGKAWTFAYDSENRLVRAEKTEVDEAKTIKYLYDPFGRRIEKKITDEDGDVKTERFFYDNEDILLTGDSGNHTIYRMILEK